MRWKLCLVGLVLSIWAAAGCRVLPDKALSLPADQVIYKGFSGPPRIRYGAYPTSILGTPWVGPNLGAHSYNYSPAEKNGIAYTCRGGHIDIIHLRIATDWSAYLTAETYRCLMKNDPGFSYKLAVDRSREYVQFSYPANWTSLPEPRRREIAKEIALAVGPYMTFTMTTWHEVLTWFGFKCIGLPTEFPSAFSWEDSYSNLLGAVLAGPALQDAEHSYNEAVKIALDREMEKLGIQPASLAKKASESVKGKWYTGSVVLTVDMKKRNFDIGLGDGLVTPTLIPQVSGCPDAAPVSCPVPKLDVLARHGFGMTLEIEPREWESGKILRVIFGDKPQKRIRPEEHFPIVMDFIRQAATARYGPENTADEDPGPRRAPAAN